MTLAVRRLTIGDAPRLRQLWTDEWAGVVTYLVRGSECEIISLNSPEPNRGIGSALIEAVVEEARRQACRRVFLTTTNDNLRALGFYQRRGFAITAVRRGALCETRRRKPAIPVMGENGIPLRDEIELQMPLSAE